MILRFPNRETPEQGISLPPQVRIGKSAYWIQIDPKDQDWPNLLMGILEKLAQKKLLANDAVPQG